MDPVDVYQKYGVDVLSKILPLPQAEEVEFLFGCECDMDADMNIGLAKSNYDKFCCDHASSLLDRQGHSF